MTKTSKFVNVLFMLGTELWSRQRVYVEFMSRIHCDVIRLTQVTIILLQTIRFIVVPMIIFHISALFCQNFVDLKGNF